VANPAQGKEVVGLTWFTISDFSPGIIQNSAFALNPQSPVPGPKPGAAQYNTVNCIALPNGGLAPLPGVKSSFNNGEAGFVTGAIAYGQVGFGNQPSLAEFPNGGDEILTAFETLSGNTRTWDLVGFQESTMTPYTIDFASGTSSEPAIWSTSMVLTQFGTNVGGVINGPISRVAISHHMMLDGGDLDTIIAYPNIITPQTAPWFTDISGGHAIIAGPLIAHNNRVICLTPLPTPWAAPTGVPQAFYTSEVFNFTDPPGTQPFPAQQAEQFVVEYPFMHGAWGSISNGELMLIRHQGGAYIISGDLINPSVTRLFSVTPTQGLTTLAGETPIGLVYGSKNNGVWVWGGGSTSVKISPQLNDDAIQLPTIPHLTTYGPMSNFNQLGDLVYCPNNWVFSTTLNSWWRWSAPGLPFAAWHWPTFDGQGMWVWPIESFSNTPNFIKLSRLTPATSYTWQSYPMPFSKNRQVAVRGVSVRAQGHGTITVSFADPQGVQAGTEPVTININSVSPTLTQLVAAANGYDITMTLMAQGVSGGPAPVIYDVSVGYREGTLVSPT
jgi:hypothetical protein